MPRRLENISEKYPEEKGSFDGHGIVSTANAHSSAIPDPTLSLCLFVDCVSYKANRLSYVHIIT